MAAKYGSSIQPNRSAAEAKLARENRRLATAPGSQPQPRHFSHVSGSVLRAFTHLRTVNHDVPALRLSLVNCILCNIMKTRSVELFHTALFCLAWQMQCI